jgi:exonuclease VII small subunit
MPVIGEVRVLPQSLEDSYDRLRTAVEKLESGGDPEP